MAACQPHAHAVPGEKPGLAPTTIMRMLAARTNANPASWQRLWTAPRFVRATPSGPADCHEIH